MIFVIPKRCVRIAPLLIILLSGGLASFAGSPAERDRIRLFPQFATGESLHYQFEIRTSTRGHSTTPIANPEAPSSLEQSATIGVRLDVLEVKPGPAGAMGNARLRLTYEKVTVATQSDAYDPQAAELEEQYRSLEGRSMEFTIEPNGQVGEVTGLEAVLPNTTIVEAVRAWMAGLSSGASLPKQGIAIGDKWSAERAFQGAPLTGIVWRTESTYLRNEGCRPGSTPAVASVAARAAEEEQCAVILTRFQILQKQTKGDMTPEDYRKNGLRTSGKWTGSGESLDSVSLRTGIVMSVTQSSTQDMDFTISSASAPSRLTYSGHVQSQSQITLMPNVTAPH
jgi:hypothetical protein